MKTMKKYSTPIFCAALLSAAAPVPAFAREKPNVIVILADDLGCGDVSAYVAGTPALKTPNIDRLAENGLRFRRAYAASATSSPSRYALLTGVYPWRERVKILPGDAPLIIPTDKPTLASMFRENGYRTGVVGKWHLGLGKGGNDWNGRISPGPREIGFDESFITAATNDRVPCVFLSDGRVVGADPADPIEVSFARNFEGEPTGASCPDLLKIRPSHGHADSIVNGISRIGFMKGGNAARWTDETMAETFSSEALKFIEKNKDRPFFLYYALHQPHVPRVPNPKFAGKSGLGPRGDVVLEADAQVGELLDFLEREGLAENTLVIFSSDNGPVLDDGYVDDAEKLARERGHSPTNGLRGGKYSLFEGGTRVPLVVSWRGRVAPGVSDAPVSLLDLYASLAALTGGRVPAGTDSRNHLGVFLGEETDGNAGRKSFVVEACGNLAYREGDFVFIPAHPKSPRIAWQTGIEMGNAETDALYEISEDAAQRENLAEKLPETAAKLRAAMIRETGGRL